MKLSLKANCQIYINRNAEEMLLAEFSPEKADKIITLWNDKKCYCQDTDLSTPHYTDDHPCTECNDIYKPTGANDIRCKNCGNHQRY